MPISNSGAEGAFGLPQKFPVRETNIPSLRFMDENESEWLESVAMTPQGIQSFLEEKEIVCWEWFPDTVDGWFPDTISLLQPNGMVEIVGSIPSCITHKVHTLEYGMVRWGSPETPSHTQMIMMKEMKYIIEFLSFAVLTLACLYGFIILMVMI